MQLAQCRSSRATSITSETCMVLRQHTVDAIEYNTHRQALQPGPQHPAEGMLPVSVKARANACVAVGHVGDMLLVNVASMSTMR